MEWNGMEYGIWNMEWNGIECGMERNGMEWNNFPKNIIFSIIITSNHGEF